MPRGKLAGSVTRIDRSTAFTAISLRFLPVASIRLMTAGATLSLNRSCTIFGASATTLPSPGSVATSEACADAPVAQQRHHSNSASTAIRRIGDPIL